MYRMVVKWPVPTAARLPVSGSLRPIGTPIVRARTGGVAQIGGAQADRLDDDDFTTAGRLVRLSDATRRGLHNCDDRCCSSMPAVGAPPDHRRESDRARRRNWPVVGGITCVCGEQTETDATVWSPTVRPESLRRRGVKTRAAVHERRPAARRPRH